MARPEHYSNRNASMHATNEQEETLATEHRQRDEEPRKAVSRFGLSIGWTRSLLAVGLFGSCVSLAACSGCGVRPLPTVSGPETTGLVGQAVGCIAMDRPVGGIVAIRLRDRKEIVVRYPHQGRDIIDFVSGPDAEGRLVFVEDHMGAKTHSLKAIKIDSTNEAEVFLNPGDALWDNPMTSPQLAPRGGLVAFLTQPARPFAPPMKSGLLEIWDINTKSRHDMGVAALNQGLSWFPDGKHLAYVQSGEPAAVYELSVDTGERKLLHLGTHPVVSTDGESVLINVGRDENLLVDLKTGSEKQVSWPGNWRGPIAFLGGDLILYWGLPSEGTVRGFTENNSPLVGPKPMGSLKLAKLGTGEFQTIIPYIDPRRTVSFGSANACL